MKPILYVINFTLALFIFVSVSFAELVGDQNWADDVEDYSNAIQNYVAKELMDDTTTWWLTGPPDASATDDFVGGWRTGDTPNEYIVMHWETPLIDWPGDDLIIRGFGGNVALANVLASVDGITYTNIGTFDGNGVPQQFVEQSFDFTGQFAGDISYVKVERVTYLGASGLFFDAFGSTVTPDLIPGDANDDKIVDQYDAKALAMNWGKECYATWEMGDFNGDDIIDAADVSIMAANWGRQATQEAFSTVPEPGTAVLLLIAIGTLAMRRRRF